MYGRLIREAFYDGDKEPDQETQGFFRLMASYIEPHFFLEGNVICRYHKPHTAFKIKNFLYSDVSKSFLLLGLRSEISWSNPCLYFLK